MVSVTVIDKLGLDKMRAVNCYCMFLPSAMYVRTMTTHRAYALMLAQLIFHSS